MLGLTLVTTVAVGASAEPGERRSPARLWSAYPLDPLEGKATPTIELKRADAVAPPASPLPPAPQDSRAPLGLAIVIVAGVLVTMGIIVALLPAAALRGGTGIVRRGGRPAELRPGLVAGLLAGGASLLLGYVITLL